MAEDLRTTRTKAKIKDSFINLLKTSTYEQITVSDIAKNANINRVTFYTHYIDKPCLLADIMLDMKKKFVVDAIEYANNLQEDNEVIKYAIGLSSALLDVFLKNRDLILILANKENAVISKLLEEQINSFIMYILNKLDQVTPLKYPIKYVAAFVAPAYIAFCLTYITDTSPVPEEEFKKQLNELTESLLNNKLFTK